jgi:hypothetical protein
MPDQGTMSDKSPPALCIGEGAMKKSEFEKEEIVSGRMRRLEVFKSETLSGQTLQPKTP